MPRKKQLNTPAPTAQTKTVSLSDVSAAAKMEKFERETAEWQAANARAKEIIMASLIPGSEAWKIAEPLELASDIWKAIEQRYAPKDAVYRKATEQSDRQRRESGLVPDVETKSSRAADQSSRSTSIPTPKSVEPVTSITNKTEPAASASTESTMLKSGSQRRWDVNEDTLDEESRQKRKEAQAAAARILVEHMPNRDQRFLWAVLHGGKEETMAWFYGTAKTNVTAVAEEITSTANG